MVVVAVIRKEVIVVIIVRHCAALVEEHKVEEFLSGRNARFAWTLTRHSMLELQALFEECRNGRKDYKNQHHCNAGGSFNGGEEDASNGERVRHNGP
jgi:hypothetical protein